MAPARWLVQNGRLNRSVGVAVIALGLAAIAMGGVFIQQGVSKNNYIKNQMRDEQITLGIGTDAQPAQAGDYVDSRQEAMAAAALLQEHRQAIAPTYSALGRFDPTNPDHLKYAQALNLEEYLFLSALGFGTAQVVIALGGFMLLTGTALSASGAVILRVATKTSRAEQLVEQAGRAYGKGEALALG